MTSFIYQNAPDSGLGDRILDLLNVYSYAMLKEYEKFYVLWNYNKNFDRTRQCLKIEHVLNYIIFPNNIELCSKHKINQLVASNNSFVFRDCVGAQSLYSFSKKYVDEKDRNKYEEIYFNVCKLFSMKNIPEDVVKNIFNNNITTIHIRRTDKVNNKVNNGAHGVNNNELIILDDLTKSFIIKELDNHKKVCIISDDKNIKQQYINSFITNNIINFDFDNQVEQAFVDYYCLMYSSVNFLSQQFSTFSITASLLGIPSQLYYPFDHGRIYNYDFNKYDNINLL